MAKFMFVSFLLARFERSSSDKNGRIQSVQIQHNTRTNCHFCSHCLANIENIERANEKTKWWQCEKNKWQTKKSRSYWKRIKCHYNGATIFSIERCTQREKNNQTITWFIKFLLHCFYRECVFGFYPWCHRKFLDLCTLNNVHISSSPHTLLTRILHVQCRMARCFKKKKKNNIIDTAWLFYVDYIVYLPFGAWRACAKEKALIWQR